MDEYEVNETLAMICDMIDEWAGDTHKLTSRESLVIYRGLKAHCDMWTNTLSREVNQKIAFRNE